MNATGLPIPTVSAAATPPSVEPGAALMTASAPAPTDFVLALAQMLGASVPATKTESQLATVHGTSDEDSTDPEAAALALLPLPIGHMQAQPQWVQQQAESFDPLEMLGLTPRAEGATARDAALLRSLTERAAGVETTPQEPQLPNAALPSLAPVQQRPATTDAAAHARPMQHPVGTQAWADELGARLTMMTEKGQHTASLRLSPEHLGPLEIRIAMRDDQASVWFGAAHADTRAAIEHALPRLRELFAAQGMSLADAGVFREPPKHNASPGWRSAGNARADGAMSTEIASAVARVQVGLLDAYA